MQTLKDIFGDGILSMKQANDGEKRILSNVFYRKVREINLLSVKVCTDTLKASFVYMYIWKTLSERTEWYNASTKSPYNEKKNQSSEKANHAISTLTQIDSTRS